MIPKKQGDGTFLAGVDLVEYLAGESGPVDTQRPFHGNYLLTFALTEGEYRELEKRAYKQKTTLGACIRKKLGFY